MAASGIGRCRECGDCRYFSGCRKKRSRTEPATDGPARQCHTNATRWLENMTGSLPSRRKRAALVFMLRLFLLFLPVFFLLTSLHLPHSLSLSLSLFLSLSLYSNPLSFGVVIIRPSSHSPLRGKWRAHSFLWPTVVNSFVLWRPFFAEFRCVLFARRRTRSSFVSKLRISFTALQFFTVYYSCFLTRLSWYHLAASVL